MKFYDNGFLVKELEPAFADRYIGVETGEWSLIYNDDPNLAWVVKYVDDNIALSWDNPDNVDVCTDFEFIKSYYAACRAEGLNVEVLYCQTTSRYPKCSVSNMELKMKFIGYDYAYPGGSYYSAVFSDIVAPSHNLFPQFRTNQHGLLENEEQMERFIVERDKKSQNKENEMLLEKGNFIVYKLWQVCLESLL